MPTSSAITMYQQLYLILTVILAVCEAEKCMHPPPSTQYSNSLYAGKECFSKNGQICFVSIFASLTYPANFGNLPVPCICALLSPKWDACNNPQPRI